MFQAEAAKELSVNQIYAASFVYCRGVRLITVLSGERGSVAFFFDNADGLAERTLAEYYEGGLIAGNALHKALRALKNELNAAKADAVSFPRPTFLHTKINS